MTEISDTAQRLAEQARRKQKKEKIRNLIGLVVLGGAFVWSSAVVAWRTFGPNSGSALFGDKTVIRFAHWQLEGDTVRAVDWAIGEYEKINPDVRVLQIPIPERAYQQWLRVRLIGRTAPDLIEMNMVRWQNIIVKYFSPVSEYIDQPNPYNAGEFAQKRDENLVYPDEMPELAGMAWRKTYIDNMKGSWVNDLQDYYGMPMSVFTIRIFANADIISEATGMSLPELRRLVGVPTDAEKAAAEADGQHGQEEFTLSDFFGICESVKELARKKGGPGSIVPIAGSKYIAGIFRDRYFQMALWGLRDDVDNDYDGSSTAAERIEAVFTGQIDLTRSAEIAAAHKLLFEISEQFNPGFAQSDRDMSVFLFTQAKAAMIATGSWEAGTLYGIVGDRFDILVFDFPLAGPDSPYAEFVSERISEAGIQAGFPMCLTKHSTQKAQAIDFMHFMTSRRINEQLNKRFKWFPAIRGAGTVPELTNFRPKIEGIWKVFEMQVGNDTRREYEQAYEGFIAAAGVTDLDAHYSQFIQGYKDEFQKYALSDFQKTYESRYDRLKQMERQTADSRMRAIRAGKGFADLSDVQKRNIASLIAGSGFSQFGRQLDKYRIEQVKQQTGGNIQDGQEPGDQP